MTRQFANSPRHPETNGSGGVQNQTSNATDRLGQVAENAQELAGKLAEQAQVYGEQARSGVDQKI
jgi:hypothetical protein